MKKLLLALVVLALLGGGVGAWLAFLPNTAGDEAASVRLPEGTSFEAALDSLDAAGALGSRASMETFGRLAGWGDQVKTGHYVIEPGMSNWAVLDKIRKGFQDPIRITIPGGLTPERFGRVLERQLGVDSAAVVAAVRAPDLAEQLGTDTAHLFGHMRANTYDILWTTDARRAVQRIHEWHERFWTDERRAQAEALGFTPDEVITLASIVQWEASKAEERETIAGVYLNRILGRTPAGRMRLQADPTVQYALMQTDGGPMRRLFFRDYRFQHPYNTYLIDGLPPGPINNPSDDAIEAVLSGGEGDYLYFVADGTGGHDFSRTNAEHQAKARRWSQYLQEQTRIRRQREAAEAAAAAGP
ncbi:MAG: endolytic transglycosylase MltG [Bacteroidota bacterium]